MLQQLLQQRMEIDHAILAELERRYPLGTQLTIPAGKGTTSVQVVGHQCIDQPRLVVENIKTGSRRTVALPNTQEA